jgi:tripartite-type tricarboxylate transporter receptor subunit TctC
MPSSQKNGEDLMKAMMGLSVAAALTMAVPAPAQAQDFYAGKTITIIVGSDAGGGYDTYARLFARHLPRLIPGKPTVVVQNMPGAGSARAAGHLSRIAAKDGTVMGIVQPGAVVGPLIEGKPDPKYDATKFFYLGSADSSNRVCITMADSRIKTFDDAQREKVIAGTAGTGSSSRDYAFLHKNTSGANFTLVGGYVGMADLYLALERGEVDTICGFDWASVKAQRPNFIRDKKINVLVQAGLEPFPELTAMGVSEIWKYTKGERNTAIVQLIVSQQLFGRPFMLPPGVPKERGDILRAAFDKAFTDPELLAEAAKMNADITPASGIKVQETIERMYSAPPDLVQAAAKAVRE